jgi:hypothetical protein
MSGELLRLAVRVSIARRHDQGVFALVTRVAFSMEERWMIEAHDLYHHIAFDRTPQWYAGAVAGAQRREAAEPDFQWPADLPRTAPREWRPTVEALLLDSVYIVTFNSAWELDEFEPRLGSAFEQFSRFLHRYGSRPQTVVRRL